MKIKISILILMLFVVASCNDQEFLSKNPTNILLEDQIWSDSDLAYTVLTDLYDRYPTHQQLEAWWLFADFDEGLGSFGADHWRVKNSEYGYDFLSWWDYGYVRQVNLFIEKSTAADNFDPEIRERFIAEGRLIRAAIYFDLVKRMGGVPLITESLEYNYDGNTEALEFPRSKEYEIYDFVISEMEAIKNTLPNDPNIKTRATKGLALAIECRAALYAASIAKYGATTSSVKVEPNIVGIPASMADDYYKTALEAGQEITGYSLYLQDDDLEKNFSDLFLTKEGNTEVIFAKDYLRGSRWHGFTFENIPLSMREDNDAGGKLNPSLNLVEAFEKLDNTFEPLKAGKDVYYENQLDIFEGRDARLAGTVILPGSKFRSRNVDIQAGLKLPNGDLYSINDPGKYDTIPGTEVTAKIVGNDGPVQGRDFTTQTGFLIRKYLDTNKGTGRRGTGSDVWWIRYRYGEVLLNMAEAAFELGQNDVSVGYLNQVRARAGFETPLTAADLSLNRFVHERQVELAFEDHRVWDLKRWRLAHVIWNGQALSIDELDNNLADATSKNTQMYGLLPYKVYNPGDEHDGQWIFVKSKPQIVGDPERWRLGNYYSEIPADVLANNPKLVRNPIL